MATDASADMQARWLPVSDAAVVLGISDEMLRLRMSRRTIRTRFEADGQVLVRVPYDLTDYVRAGITVEAPEERRADERRSNDRRSQERRTGSRETPDRRARERRLHGRRAGQSWAARRWANDRPETNVETGANVDVDGTNIPDNGPPKSALAVC